MNSIPKEVDAEGQVDNDQDGGNEFQDDSGRRFTPQARDAPHQERFSEGPERNDAQRDRPENDGGKHVNYDVMEVTFRMNPLYNNRRILRSFFLWFCVLCG